MAKAWFEQWFNTKYYHILYSHRNESEARKFLIKLMDFLSIPAKSKIIDIGCGRGRHAKFLSEMGYEVTGIDLAKSSIDYAKRFEGKKLHFFCFDKRNIFKKGHFDLALNLFTSFGYLKNREDLEKALTSMGSNLKKGSVFVLDYLNAHQIKHCDLSSTKIVNDNVVFEISKEIKGHQIIKQIDVSDGDFKQTFYEEVHLITEDEFRALFEVASMNILHTFGNYDLEEFDPKNSDRLIIIAQKR